MLNSHRCSEGGKSCETHLCLKRELTFDRWTVLTQTDVRVCNTSAQTAAWLRNAHLSE